MKKRRLKLRKTGVFLISMIIILFLFFFSKSKNIELMNTIDYISLIESYNIDGLDNDFLKWIKGEYSEDVLKKVNNYLEKENYDENIWHKLTGNSYIVLRDLFSESYNENNSVTYIEGNKESFTIGYAGDVSLADNWAIMPYYNSRKRGVFGILSEEIVDKMKSFDWMIVNSEFAFSDRGSPMKNKQYTFRASPNNVKVYDEMGVDMVTLANNHVYDYGKTAFLDTLTTLKNNNIAYVGAGINNKEAQYAHYLVINGYKISFLSATRAEKYIMTPEAKENTPGVFRCYNPTKLSNRIKEEKQNSDYVVVLIHWGTEGTHKLENVQQETAKLYIDSGADMVIGHHAHVLQGFEVYKNKLIAYNLGNFIFNSLTVNTGILTWTLDFDGNSVFKFIPALQKNRYTDILKTDDSISLYNKINSWSINSYVENNGEILFRED